MNGVTPSKLSVQKISRSLVVTLLRESTSFLYMAALSMSQASIADVGSGTCLVMTATAYDHHDGSAIDVAKKYKYFVVSRAACHQYTTVGSIDDIDTAAKALSRGEQQSVGSTEPSDHRRTGAPTQTYEDNDLLGEQFECKLKQGSSG
jgi:hypothetical protein